MIQLEGPITIGGTDFSDEITVCTITRRRNLTTVPSTFGNARSVQKAGSIVEEATFTFLNDKAAASVWLELYDAIDTDSAELAVVARLDDAAVGADNPSFSFTVVVTGVSVGGTVGEQNTQNWTYPITSAGITKATS